MHLRSVPSTPRDVTQDNVVFNMTKFIDIQDDVDEDTGMRIARHPGGQDIPMQFAGKDASAYWNDIHGHVKFDILEDLTMGEGFNTGLDVCQSSSPPLCASPRRAERASSPASTHSRARAHARWCVYAPHLRTCDAT